MSPSATFAEGSPPAVSPVRKYGPWVVAAAVVVPTFMEVLDTTIANVALRYMAGGLSAPSTDSEWVITSYLAANAIILPISGWLSVRLGRRNYFLLSIAVFTIASVLCGIAGSLNMLIASRILQGLAGGGLQPVSQGILLDAFPKEKQGAAMTLFGIAALLAPVVGPTLGGFITDHYGWRWIFYLNVPVGLFAFLFSRAVVADPDHIREEREEMKRKGSSFDSIGLSLLIVTMVCWEIALSKGQEWDWFGDPFYRVHIYAGLFVFCLGSLIYRELRIASPLIDFRTLKDANFRSCCLIIFCVFGVLYANTTMLPGLLQSLFGYDATTSGLVLSPAGVFAVIMLMIVGKLLGAGADARYLMGGGLLVLALGNYWMARMNLDIGPWMVVWPRVVVIAGLSMIFAPLNVAAFAQIPTHLRGAAVGLLALLRNEGGSVGTTLAKTVQERRDQLHSLRLGESLDPFNPAVTDYLASAKPVLVQQLGDPVSAKLLALQYLAGMRAQQAAALAYFDTFWGLAVVSVCLVFLLPLIHRAVAAKGAHVAAE